MAYAFHLKDDSLQSALRRIAGAELASAEVRLRSPDATAIHDCRKHLKKTRALLRLVRAGLRDQPAENAALRAIGLALSGPRDAQVRLGSLHRLFPEGLPEPLHPLRDHLQARSSEAATIPAGLADQLAALRHRAARWRLRGKDGAILREGLAATRRKVRLCQTSAITYPDNPEHLHDWRKRAKDHWYQARLFAPCRPHLFAPMIEDAETLTEALGDQRDFQALGHYAQTLPETLTPPEARQILAPRITTACAALQATALPLSTRLYAAEPDEAARLWVKWYKDWR